jgi:hypothetical protein
LLIEHPAPKNKRSQVVDNYGHEDAINTVKLSAIILNEYFEI